MRFVVHRDRSDPPGKLGRGCMTLFSLAFLGMGLLFTVFVAGGIVQRVRIRSWKPVECVIRESGVQERGGDDGDHRFHVVYEYKWNGREHLCSGVEPDYGGSSDYAEVQRLADAYPVGGKAMCRVNPENPAEAYLRPGSLWFGLIILFPLVFVAAGAGGIWFAWRGLSASARGDGESAPISSRATGTKARWIPVAFCSVFFLAGLGLFLGLFLPALLDFVDSKNWTPTPCTVLSSSVKSHRGDDSTTYSVDILYEYRLGGKTYRSNRYTFMGGSSSGYEGKKEVVDRHPPGASATCYVNPKDPAEAVLERGFTWELLFGLIPLVFMLFGGIGLFFALRAARGGAGVAPGAVSWRRSTGTAAAATGLPAETGPVTLKAQSTPLGAFIGLTVFALLWNGILSLFVWEAVQGWRKGSPDWFGTIFLLPFVLIGLGVLVGALYQLLALFNPRPEITASAGAVPLGGTLDIAWKVPGLDRRITRLHIRLEGREEATYRRGTSTVTDRRPFAASDLVDARSAYEIRGGRATLAIPADTMHSFQSDNNKVVWVLRVHGEIDRWPDVKLEFPITVLPA